jgi:hypothetical protein
VGVTLWSLSVLKRQYCYQRQFASLWGATANPPAWEQSARGDGASPPESHEADYSLRYTCTRKMLGSSLNSRHLELTCMVKKNISPPFASSSNCWVNPFLSP